MVTRCLKKKIIHLIVFVFVKFQILKSIENNKWTPAEFLKYVNRQNRHSL